jgi:PIN domain nuclease of toxin-antitoxin system
MHGEAIGDAAVRIMLYTHALIWALEASPQLSKTARSLIEDPNNDVLVSAASAWEIAIKKTLGRLKVPSDLIEAVDEAGFVRRPLGFGEARRLESLPRHHEDPFDRMILAHALEEGATLVTRDRQMARYQVPIVW